jgi:mannosyltransferase
MARPPPDGAVPGDGAVLRPAPQPVRRWVGPAAGLSAAAVLGWGLTTPALWLDESATAIATQRGWPELWHLLEGSEAPLVPFYAVEKVAVTAAHAVLPAGAVPPELLYRLPALAAAVVAVWVLAAWLSRVAGSAGRSLAVAATGVLLLLPAFSRYGQEARPYAFTLAAGVLATVAWSRLVLLDPPRPAPGRSARRTLVLALAGYAAAVTALTLAQVLAASLVAAHLALAAAAPGPLGRRRALRRTAAGAAAGLLPVLPFAAVTWLFGTGPMTAPHAPTPGRLVGVAFQLFAEPEAPVAGVVVLLAAALGAAQVRSARHGTLAKVALAWALVPPAVLLPLVWVQPNLVTYRYLVFTLPGWAILAGLGVVALAERARRSAPASSWDGAVLAGGVVAMALVATAALQVPALAAVRGPAGHGEDIRPALRAAHLDGRGDLPLVVHSRAAAELVPYAGAAEPRLLGVELQRTTRSIWPVTDRPATLDARLRDHPRVVLLLRGSRAGMCGWRAGGPVSRYVTRCMPDALREQGFRVVHAEAAGRRWTMAVLTRPSR